MAESLRISIEEPSQTAEARRMARKMAQDICFDEVRKEQVAIAVTEACTNILKYAGTGEILLRIIDGVLPELELLAIDRGPGMSSVDQCLRDGYTTGTSPGQGLGAIKRLADVSDFYSVAGKGTVVMARWLAHGLSNGPSNGPSNGLTHPGSIDGDSLLRIGAVNISKRGQQVCGDSWGVEQTAETATFLVADGLGHGYEASLASLEAVRTLHGNPTLPPMALIELSHKALRSSRGAAVAVARIDRMRRQLTFSGVGNISAQIYSGSAAGQHLVSVNGTAGHEASRIREFSYSWPDNGMLIIHSDGLSTSTGLEAQPGLALHDPGVVAAVLYRDFQRGQDDATVVVAKAP
jgi:anti-sigma regulatory factor (Ser/Thr protein kinase)